MHGFCDNINICSQCAPIEELSSTPSGSTYLCSPLPHIDKYEDAHLENEPRFVVPSQQCNILQSDRLATQFTSSLMG